ncbi:hypothetical protein BDP27DRAFT_1375012 [Rhodocollybia butyracea]|uniref:Uncharacterized protein n=1 Tax=Rhodocollybia butyracea TaxID=206335 RepID=A0A9P5TW97_9AGAR|nr:hypothetical protein BDP27DRAFT_1375012 [Rhodocollybia butyracea]
MSRYHAGPFPGFLILHNPSIISPRKILVENRSESITVPSHIWTLDGTDPTLLEGTPNGVLIRQEYVELILAILEWLKSAQKKNLAYNQRHEEFIRQSTKVKQLDREKKTEESPIVDRSSVEQEANRQLSASHNQPDPSSSDAVLDIKLKEVDVDRSDPSDPLAIRLVPAPDINALDVFPNPFALSENKNVATGFGLVATGLPGIGDFLFSGYRVMLSQVVPEDVSAMILSDTWCLVDSNRSLVDVPEFLTARGGFIIQAASPRELRMEWKKKHTNAYYLVMKPWTAEELVSGLQLQGISRIKTTAESLVKLRDRFGGSALDAYRYASDMSLFEAVISGAARRINEDVAEHGHMLLSVFPLSDRDRREYLITSPSKYLYERVLSIINKDREVASLRLYSICLNWPASGTKALAGQIFERHHNQIKHS